jgi:hypothetical protein
MVNILKKNNSTALDDKGLKYSLVRGSNEPLEDFHKRILKANSNLEHEKFKIETSLTYATPLKGFDIFKIDVLNENEIVDIAISDTRIQISVEGELKYKKKLSEIKFLKHLKTDLDALGIFTIDVVTSEDWEYLSASNLLQNSSMRTRLRFKTSNGYTAPLPEKNVESVQDHLGYFVEDVFYDYAITNESHYALENNVLFKSKQINEDVFYSYLNFPLFVSWSPIKSYSINKETFNDILNKRIKNNEVFGIIETNPEVDNNETVEVLSQKGAKIINKILTKHNSYWGE